jgi:4-carboxymuconolactone decarboxylase
MTMITRLTIATLLLSFAATLPAQDRMPPIPAGKQTEAQKKAVIDYKNMRKADLTGPPWSVLRSPGPRTGRAPVQLR